VTIAVVDLRVGGKWRWVMVTTEGGFEVAFHGEYREIVPNERVVYTEVFEGVPGGDDAPAVNTMTLTEVDGRTTVTTLTEFGTREIRDMVIGTGMEAGMQDAMDLLEEVAISLK
ncbi:MAG: SRPBCC domain-containing protein, partial [Actinomycetota bacterium]